MIIQGSGPTYTVTLWICAISIAVFVLDLAKAVLHGQTGMASIWSVGAALFGYMLLGAVSTRVILDGDEISCEGFLQKTRSIRLEQIRAARSIAHAGYRAYFHYLVIQPLDEGMTPIKIRTDLFSHADVQTIREFLADKLIKR